MAYSDYGGYAYKNGKRVAERSDAVVSPEGVQSTPGQWPGWVLEAGRNGDCNHVLLGSGPIFVGLYKQSSVSLYRLGDELCPADYLVDREPEAISEFEWNGKLYRTVNADHFRDKKSCLLSVDDIQIEINWREDDNFYVFAKVTEPDGTMWHGWSGYGVGAGLEDCGYGFSTSNCEEILTSIWPEAIV